MPVLPVGKYIYIFFFFSRLAALIKKDEKFPSANVTIFSQIHFYRNKLHLLCPDVSAIIPTVFITSVADRSFRKAKQTTQSQGLGYLCKLLAQFSWFCLE